MPVTITALRQTYTFNNLGALGSYTLANTTIYGVTLSSQGLVLDGVKWGNTDVTASDAARSPTDLNGYTYLTFRISGDDGSNWITTNSTFNAITVNVIPIDINVEPYAAFQSVGLNALRLQREMLINQAGDCKQRGWAITNGVLERSKRKPTAPITGQVCVFATGGNANSTLRGNGELNGYDAALAGGFYGIEVQTSPSWTIGAAYGYGTAALSNLGATNNSVSSTINSAAMYGVYRPDHQWAFRALAGYSAFHLSGQRYPITIGHTNPISGTTTAQGATAALQADLQHPAESGDCQGCRSTQTDAGSGLRRLSAGRIL